MVRTQIQLPEAEYDRLREVAARQRRSLADCIREGIALFLSQSKPRSSRVAEVAGKYTPVSTADLKSHDQAWADSAVGRK
jgi:hypothetical protein